MQSETGQAVYPDNRWTVDNHLKICNEVVLSRPSLVHPDRSQIRSIIHEASRQISIDEKEEIRKWDYLVSRAKVSSVTFERLRDPLVVFRHRLHRSLLTIMYSIIEDFDDVAR